MLSTVATPHLFDRLGDRRTDTDGISRRLNRQGRRYGGSMVARATRHLTGWTPVPLSNTAPLTIGFAVGNPKGRAPRFEDADVDAVGTPSSRLDAAPKPGCPTLAGQGRGYAPTAPPTRGRVYFHWGENCLAAPRPSSWQMTWRQRTDPVGWVRLTGIRLSPIPTSCGVAPEGTASLYHR